MFGIVGPLSAGNPWKSTGRVALLASTRSGLDTSNAAAFVTFATRCGTAGRAVFPIAAGPEDAAPAQIAATTVAGTTAAPNSRSLRRVLLRVPCISCPPLVALHGFRATLRPALRRCNWPRFLHRHGRVREM